jgi:general secretion pathway protein G
MRTRIANKAARAFTLIEILIVVVILGILAAIVIPQFTDASQEAQDASVRSQLQTIRSQIELFKVQNPTTTLTAANLFTNLVGGDYLQQAPRNPLQPAATADDVGAAAAANVGWVWDGDDFFATDGAGALFVE